MFSYYKSFIVIRMFECMWECAFCDRAPLLVLLFIDVGASAHPQYLLTFYTPNQPTITVYVQTIFPASKLSSDTDRQPKVTPENSLNECVCVCARVVTRVKFVWMSEWECVIA